MFSVPIDELLYTYINNKALFVYLTNYEITQMERCKQTKN